MYMPSLRSPPPSLKCDVSGIKAKRPRSTTSGAATPGQPSNDKKDKSEDDRLRELCMAAEVKVEAENVLQMVESEKGMSGVLPKQLENCLSKLAKRVDSTRLKHYQPYGESGSDEAATNQPVTMHVELTELKEKLENYLPVVRAVQAKKDTNERRASYMYNAYEDLDEASQKRMPTALLSMILDRQMEEVVDHMLSQETDDGLTDALAAFTTCLSDEGEEKFARDAAGDRMFGVATVPSGPARAALQEKHTKETARMLPHRKPTLNDEGGEGFSLISGLVDAVLKVKPLPNVEMKEGFENLKTLLDPYGAAADAMRKAKAKETESASRPLFRPLTQGPVGMAILGRVSKVLDQRLKDDKYKMDLARVVGVIRSVDNLDLPAEMLKGCFFASRLCWTSTRALRVT